MPVYAKVCRTCAWETDFALEPYAEKRPCPDCGGETDRVWKGRSSNIIPDTFTTPVVDSVMTAKRQVHYSRSERNARMKDNKLQEFVRWTSGGESDKSSPFGRWDAPPPGFLEHWETYWRERYPLTDAEKQRVVLTDDQTRVDVVDHDPASKVIAPTADTLVELAK